MADQAGIGLIRAALSTGDAGKLANVPADTNAELAAKVAKNSSISGATKTKITYDAKGLVTSGADATTADIADSTDKRYCTDTQKTAIGNLPANTTTELAARPATIVSGTSGEAITLGYAVGVKNASGVPKVYKASATAASTPGVCTGIATTTVGAADLAISVQSAGLSGVIPDAAWDSLPAVTDVGSPVYLSKTAGKFTLDVSAFVVGDRAQQVGTLAVGGTGACKIQITIGEKKTATSLASVGIDILATGTVPAFVANAASIAPGTDTASEYTIESSRTLAAASDLTVATTGSPVTGNYLIVCRALALGYAITVINGGAGAGTVGTFGASLTKPLGLQLYYDGTNFSFVSYYYLQA